VWRIGLDVSTRQRRALEVTLSEAERERASRFRTETLQHRFIAAHGALRHLLAQYVEQPPATLTFTVSAHGKPELVDSALRFNLSHSEALALCAVTLRRAVGVDVECVKPLPDLDEVAQRFFSAREQEMLRTLNGDEKLAGFYRCWTRKEAFIKALGTGLSHPLDSFDVTVRAEEPAQFLGMRAGAADRWSLAHLDPGAGYVGAVCAEGEAWRVEWVEFEWPANKSSAGSYGRCSSG
jgi:4'-phosphopantetheinyl transferase